MRIDLTQKELEALQTYSKLLNKDSDTIIHEALKLYFDMVEQKLEQEQSGLTNLDYDEFWDGVDI